ncbi:hypothetical protein HK099_005541 [Clydaea vesicula]|uniref:Uncharacterized protein n=1 Tax=Clydaea vesicula TaxID=447962 RepID=A0AAD5TZ38_9FUNG|nr:hypothetical protein HK099_005541 [Clydaea vesicula]
MSTTRIDFYHDKDNNCLNYTRANQEVFTKSCVKVLLDTLNDYYNYSIKKNSKFCGSWKELASFSTWASALSKHIFITCPLIKNIHQEKNSFLMDYRYQLFEFFFNEMFVKVSLLQEKIELDLQKDLTLKFRQCITMVVTGFIEGTKDDSKKCLFNFDLQLFLIFFPLLSQLREDSSFYIRKMILEFLGSLIVSELTSTQEQFLLCLKHLVNKFDTDSPFFGTKLGLIDEKPVLKALIAKFKNLNFQNLKIKKFINKSEQHNIADQFSKDLNNKKNENIFSRYDTVEMPVQKKRELIFTPSHLYQPVEENSSFDNFLPLSNKVSIEKEQRKEISDYEGLVENHLKKIKNLENEIKLEGNGVISDNKNGELDLISSTSENNGLNHKNMNTFSNNKYENDSKTKFNLHTGLAAPNTFIHSNDNPKLETSKIFLESDNPLYHSFNHAVDAFEIEADELFQQSSIIYNDFLEEHKGGTAHVDSFQCTSNAMKNVDDDHNENQYLDILEKDHPSSKHELRFNQKTKFLENADDYKKMNSSASELNNNNFQTKKNSINSNQVSVPEVKNAQTKKNSINSNQVSVPEVKNAVTKTENLNSETFPYLQSVQILTDDPNQILSAEDRLKIQITENESFDGLKIQEQNLNKFENLKSKDISNNGAYNESPGLSSEENKPMLASVSQALNSVLQEKNIKSQKKFQLKQNLSNIVDNGLRNQKVVKNLQETETLVCENQNYSNSDAGKLKLADPNDVNIHESVFEQNVNHNSVQSKVDGKLIDDQIASNSKIDGTKLNDTTVRPMLNQCSSVNAELDKRQQFPLQKEDSILKKIEDKKESSDIFELVSESDHVHNKNKEISFFSKNVEQQISTMSPQSLQYDKQLECDLGIQAKDMQTADTSLHELFEGEMMMDEIFTEDNTKRREEVVDLTTLFSKLTKTNPLNNSSFQHEIKNEESSSYNNKFNENLTEDFEGRHFDMKKKLAVKSVTTNNEKYFDDNLVSNPPSFLATKDEFSQTDINSFKIVNIDENVTNGFENENINSYKGKIKFVNY